MTAKKKDGHEHTAGKVCKKCGRPTFAGADGKLRHERRGITQPDPAKAKLDGTQAPPPGEQEDEERPDRAHPLARTLFGKKEDK